MPEVAHLPDRKSHRRRATPAVRFLDDLNLERGRVHEACGTARRRLALMVAGAMQGPVSHSALMLSRVSKLQEQF